MPDTPHCLIDIMNSLSGLCESQNRVHIGEILHVFGGRSYGPLLTLPALITLTPAGLIPGVPSMMALTIGIISIQMVAGRHHFWIPRAILYRSLSSKKLALAIDKSRPFAARMDQWFHGRLPFLTQGPGQRLAAAGCLLLALIVPLLEFFPFAAAAPMLGIAIIGISLTVGDGVLMVAGLSIAAIAASAAYWIAPIDP